MNLGPQESPKANTSSPAVQDVEPLRNMERLTAGVRATLIRLALVNEAAESAVGVRSQLGTANDPSAACFGPVRVLNPGAIDAAAALKKITEHNPALAVRLAYLLVTRPEFTSDVRVEAGNTLMQISEPKAKQALELAVPALPTSAVLLTSKFSGWLADLQRKDLPAADAKFPPIPWQVGAFISGVYLRDSKAIERLAEEKLWYPAAAGIALMLWHDGGYPISIRCGEIIRDLARSPQVKAALDTSLHGGSKIGLHAETVASPEYADALRAVLS